MQSNVNNGGVGFRYVMVGFNERDSKFLHNNGKNSWPLVAYSPEEIEEHLRKFHNRYL